MLLNIVNNIYVYVMTLNTIFVPLIIQNIDNIEDKVVIIKNIENDIIKYIN